VVIIFKEGVERVVKLKLAKKLAEEGWEVVDDDIAQLAVRGTRPSSRRLGRNLENAGVTRPEGTAAHHIVAGGSKKADEARAALKRFNVDINSADNGLFLPQARGCTAPGCRHPNLHTNEYYDEVNRRLAQASTQEEAMAVLWDIREELLAGTFPF
jgi:hypothetical protein